MREGSVIYIITHGREGHDAVAALIAPVHANIIAVDTPLALLQLPVRPGGGCLVVDIRAHDPCGSGILREITRAHEWIPAVFVALDVPAVRCVRPALGGWEPVEVSDHGAHLRTALLVGLACDRLARQGRREYAALVRDARDKDAAVGARARIRPTSSDTSGMDSAT